MDGGSCSASSSSMELDDGSEEEEDEDQEAGFEDYYLTGCDDCYEGDHNDPRNADPEYTEFECLAIDDVEKLLNECVEQLSNSIQVIPSLAKVLLVTHHWAVPDIVQRYKKDANKLLVESRIKPGHPATADVQGGHLDGGGKMTMCCVCLQPLPAEVFKTLTCGHTFCKDCWASHFEVQVMQGVSTVIECMDKDCRVLVPEDFVLNILSKSSRRERYQLFAFNDHVKSHPELRFCPGPNCSIVVRSKEHKGKRVTCKRCKTSFCFKCGIDYHAPTDCEVIKKWLTKCADDSETANYISAHTKDCPKCHICIEKNGGCNHMQCYNCKHEFCWMCLGDWKTHGSEYYECSRYKENPNIAHESAHAQAREALKKYLFYFERWENHSKSLKLEEQTLQNLKNRIQKKVMKNEGTWIDWQYLLDAAALLARCRYTLQYTYPYAYFMEPSPRKELFEYQQAQLEAEIENLSWKIERAETTGRGDIENQMNVAEKWRTTLLKDFLDS